MKPRANRLRHISYSYDATIGMYRYFDRKALPPDTDFDAELFNGPWEDSVFLIHAMPCDYVSFTFDLTEDAIDKAINLIMKGLNAKGLWDPNLKASSLPSWDLGDWELAFGTVRDDIKLVFVPKGTRFKLSMLGLETHLHRPEDPGKCAKYLNRAFAPSRRNELALFGDITDVGPDHFQTLCQRGTDMLRFDCRYLPDTPDVDGMSLCNPRTAQLVTGWADPKEGDCFRFTTLTPFGLFKGHMMVKEMKPDFVFYGAKKQVTYKGFCFMFMDELHVSEAKSDFQSLVNFFGIGEGPDLIRQEVQGFYGGVLRDLKNMDRWRDLWRAIGKPDSVQLAMAKRGLDSCFPASFRGQVNMVRPVIDDTRAGVVVMTGAARRYVMPSPWAFDDHGNFDKSHDRLQGNVVFAPGLPSGPVSFYRQPNGNRSEIWHAANVAVPHKARMGRQEVIYLGSDIAVQALQAMGGGDYDDPVIVVHNPKWVSYLQSLPAYPLVPKQEVAPLTERAARYAFKLKGLPAPNEWNANHLLEQINNLRTQITIGRVVNPIMLDTILTDSKQDLLEDLGDQIVELAESAEPEDAKKREKLLQAYAWLEKRPDYVLKEIASDLESRIDQIKLKGGVGASNKDEELINQMMEETEVFPYLWTIVTRRRQGRIPASAIKRGIVVADTRLCKLVRAIDGDIETLNGIFATIEWSLLKPLPNELFALYPRDEKVQNKVTEARSWWYAKLRQADEKGMLSTAEGRRAIYTQLVEGDPTTEPPIPSLKARLADQGFATDEELEAFACELARRTYNTAVAAPKVDAEGNYKSVPDALLWTKPLGLAFLRVLDKAGMTGLAVDVDLYPLVRKQKPFSLKVKATGGVVADAADGKVLGNAIGLPDGEYTMDGGRIVLRPVSPFLKPEWIG